MGGLEVLIGRDGEEGGVSEVLEDVVEEEKELEDDESKYELEEGVGVDDSAMLPRFGHSELQSDLYFLIA